MMKKNNMKKMIVSVGLATMLAFSAGAGTHTVDAASNYKTITIKKGDTLYALAKKYNTTVSKLKSINKLKSDRIYAGKSLKVPAVSTYKTAKQYYAELEKNKDYTKKQKAAIKKSKLIDYVVSTYKGRMDITLYVTENLDQEGDNPPFVSLELKEKSTKSTYYVFKELDGDDSEFVHDNYMLDVISYEARKLVDPSIQSTFKKKNVKYLTKVNIKPEIHKKLTEKDLKWEYKSVKNNSSSQVFLMIPDTKEYHELALKYMQAQNKNSKIKVFDYDLYFYSGPTNEKLRYVRVNKSQLGEIDTVNKLVSQLEEASPIQYKNDTRSLVKQNKLYK
ncbi:LysM peptidoglycan-binding domain-containing protein [Bacillus sp. 31A1R]|uniref:LysM peptidoglycan-binding domain-containing protein n=1 Tax=Robertmurraya mangrovi TaxID=3098077 RepID=A0ABU5J0B1_9BACI|nr:LysM peptidoglycan-binding domain-containing protein [Bacillus sp. 31A1R]MDZ5472836.1 LysM peptidoglycan-binding domain-containing protein [Bacillus sp. 31A1R]